jgi:hypothetical protein
MKMGMIGGLHSLQRVLRRTRTLTVSQKEFRKRPLINIPILTRKAKTTKCSLKTSTNNRTLNNKNLISKKERKNSNQCKDKISNKSQKIYANSS